MRKLSFILLTAVMGFSSCSQKQEVQAIQVLNSEASETVAPFLTKDNEGRGVLCWTEKDSRDSLYRLKYALYNEQTGQFLNSVTVPGSAGCSNAAESMAKVAFKADGTVIAIFAKRFTTEKNPYAGAIYYTMSTDQGKSWSEVSFLHSDTSHTYGRSFFDVATLKNGELGAIWLDGRYEKSIKGSALFFAGTTTGKGFVTERCVDKGTCECCRTDMLCDDSGNIHIAYRDINSPSALSNQQFRDMNYVVSADNGHSFSKPKSISNDNWEINGCPHSGPSLAVTEGKLHAVWFTAGGGAGLYYAAAEGPAYNFQKRTLITATGRHPQLTALKGNKSAMVFEEPLEVEKPMEMKHAHGEMKMSHMPAVDAKIFLNILNNGMPETSVEITNGHTSSHHAVITSLKSGLLIAWVNEGKSDKKINYTFVKQ